MTFIKAVLGDRCLCRRWEGLLTERLNKQYSPRCDRPPDYNHLSAPVLSQYSQSVSLPRNILIVDEINLYVAIIVLNCSFEGVLSWVGEGGSGAASGRHMVAGSKRAQKAAAGPSGSPSTI